MRIKNQLKWAMGGVLGVLFFSLALAQEDIAKKAGVQPGWHYWGIATLSVFLLLLLVLVFAQLGKSDPRISGNSMIPLKKWWKVLDAKFFTKAVAVEKEEDILLEHDYDGIRELDNSLPPWWKWGFYITVVVAALYMFRFHIWKTGPDPEQEYVAEMKAAEKQLEAHRKKAGGGVDETTVKMADAKGIDAGKQIFQKACFVCHGASGEGGVGPNLTDQYWLHGGSINDVFKSIKYGIPDKGMQAWEKTMSPEDIQNISSYILSIVGTKPANAKAPQGELYTGDAAKDSTVKDAVTMRQ